VVIFLGRAAAGKTRFRCDMRAIKGKVWLLPPRKRRYRNPPDRIWSIAVAILAFGFGFLAFAFCLLPLF
jgi:hypothetical protein